MTYVAIYNNHKMDFKCGVKNQHTVVDDDQSAILFAQAQPFELQCLKRDNDIIWEQLTLF